MLASVTHFTQTTTCDDPRYTKQQPSSPPTSHLQPLTIKANTNITPKPDKTFNLLPIPCSHHPHLAATPCYQYQLQVSKYHLLNSASYGPSHYASISTIEPASLTVPPAEQTRINTPYLSTLHTCQLPTPVTTHNCQHPTPVNTSHLSPSHTCQHPTHVNNPHLPSPHTC